jgi:hypothetical protein
MVGTMTPLRARLGQEIFRRVAGPDGPRARERIHGTAGPRWFDADSEIVRVHGDASMFIGGIRAILLQTMHPAAMKAVADHSGFKGDMWGRLARTSQFLAVTTFGTIDHAEQAIRAVRTIHERVTGTMPDGTVYAASDPHLLAWVHAAEVDSFLLAHQTYGARPAYGVLMAAGIALMPRWTRRPLLLPSLPVSERTVVRTLGALATGTIRWAMSTGDHEVHELRTRAAAPATA